MNGKIKIIGSHDHGDGKPEIIKSEFDAHCEQNGRDFIITYSDDTSDTTDSTDITCSPNHKLEIGEGTFAMLQTGAINSELRFSLGQTWDTDYQTPYGLMKMTAITRQLMVEITPKKITAHVQYELQMDGSKLSDSKVRIMFSYI